MNRETSQKTYDNNAAIRTAVNQLTDLLESLYPDPSPDIFTVRDYRNRYPFTRLGALATADIDRYQRINRAVGSHGQLGLCEYHIGLIYLHEGAFRGAVQQFDQARQQWSFVNQPAAVGLTYLGRAIALQLATHYESALVSVGKVTSWLERARFAEPFPGWKDFREQMLAYVAGMQATLRKQLDSASETVEPGLDEATADAADAAPPPPSGSADFAPAPPQTPPQVGPVDVSTTAEAETRPDGEVVTGTVTPRPISNMERTVSPTVPIPDHLLTDDRYAWYIVETRPLTDFMAEFNMGDWLLVDLQPDLTEDLQDTEQPILVVMNEEIGGTIRVRSLDPKGRFQRIYLVTLADSPVGSFQVDKDSGTVTFSAEMAEIGINRTEILGVVVGFWRPMIELLPNG